jgi:hypothetical protein
MEEVSLRLEPATKIHEYSFVILRPAPKRRLMSCHNVPHDFLNLPSPTADLQPLPKPPIPSNSNPIQNIITITTQQLNNTTYYANNNNKTKKHKTQTKSQR